MVPPGWAQEVASSSQPGSDSIPVVVSEMARHRGSDTAGMEEQFKTLMDGQAASCQRGLTSSGSTRKKPENPHSASTASAISAKPRPLKLPHGSTDLSLSWP